MTLYDRVTVTREDYEDGITPPSWYFKLTLEAKPITRQSVEQQRTVITDYDEEGDLIGIEII